MNHIQNFVKSRLKTYSQETEACPVCHSTPCTCSQVATMSEDKLLDEVKTDLVALVTANAGDIDTAEAIDVIKSATKDDLVDMIAEEIEDQGKEESLAAYIEGLSKAKDKLSGNCGEMKTHSRTFEEIRDEVIEDSRKEYERYPEEFEDIKEGILDSSMDELYSNLLKELEVAVDEDQIAFLKRITNELKSLGAKDIYVQKTYSAMAELDLQFKGDLDALLKRYESSVNGLPKIGSDDTAEEFWKKCIKWADDVEKNPEPALYNELVALGKKYNVDVK